MFIFLKEIMNSLLRNIVPTMLYVITQRIGICLTAYDCTLLYIKAMYTLHLSSPFSQDLK